MVIEHTPALNRGLHFFQTQEPLPVETLVPQFAVKTLDKAVLPRLAWCDVGRSDVPIPQPAHHRSGSELGAIIRTDILRLSWDVLLQSYYFLCLLVALGLNE